MKNFATLRDASNTFIYESYAMHETAEFLSLSFVYKLVEKEHTHTFNHQLSLHKSHLLSLDVKLDNILFHIGLIEAINYWKIATPQDFKILCGSISDKQLMWFKKLYYNGLGEFLYLNDIAISMDDLVHFDIQSDQTFSPIHVQTKENNIIPIGGGKDSLVSYELLKDIFPDSYLFSMNPIKASQRILDNHPQHSIILSRKLDPQILEFNAKGYLNGHIPFSSILGFISIWLGLVYQTKYIVLSNESSANEENVVFHGLKVNHQYSKSIEFENDFRDYISTYITKDVTYFSFLRPLDEYHIAKIFSQTPKHFPTFLSCNVSSRKDEWCGKCPKCLFTYIMLCNFIDDETMYKIFRTNMLNDPALQDSFDQLSQEHEVKPFECVGTYDEVNYALTQKIKSYGKEDLPYLLKGYTNAPQAYNFKLTFDRENNLPENFRKILKNYVNALNFRPQ